MAEIAWPGKDARRLIGTRVARVDGPAKVTGAAKYSMDVTRPRLAHARLVTCPHAHAVLESLDVETAKKVAGVLAVKVIQAPGAEIQWALDEIAVVVAETDEAAADGVAAVRATWAPKPHFVSEQVLADAPDTDPGEPTTVGEPDARLASAEVKASGHYGLAVVAHCCLEPHGTVCEWDAEGGLTAWMSTQAVHAVAGQLAEATGANAANVRVLAQHVGGGFGSKFGPDRWGVACAELARELKRPVRLFLERDAELAVAGDRPSCYADVTIGGTKDGEITAWSSKSWGSGGLGGSGSPPLPYVLEIPNRRHQHVSVPTNTAGSRAWRAPNHPQACLVTFAALEDFAAVLGKDPLEVLRANLKLVGVEARRATYERQLAKAAELSGWKERWKPRGSAKGVRRRGLGLSMHAWGGRGHRSNCEVLVQPDGSVEARIGSQDIGTGTRTVIGIVVADTLGLPLSAVKVSVGDTRLPQSSPSGGSTTVGGVSAAARRAAVAALEQLAAKVAPDLGVAPADLRAWDGAIRAVSDASRSLTWKQACARLGVTPLSAQGANPGPGELTSSGVGGVQVAEVEVDVETGVVRMVRMTAVQDCGLVIDLATAESQVHGGLIMGIAYSLCEEKVLDPVTGRLLNADMEFYKLPGLADVGELIVHLEQSDDVEARGVIGLGEPPVISPGAAISNAVANAIGVRVPHLPLTPDRVLAALDKVRA